MGGIEIASLFASVAADTTNFEKSMLRANTIINATGSALSGVTSIGIDLAKQGLDYVAKSVRGFVNDASDLNETVSKTQVLFGDTSKRVTEWAKTTDLALGQTEQQALDAASTFATFGKSAGLSGNRLDDFAIGFTKLASDMASFSNTSPQDAIDAIGAALRGESEPIRKYGVLLDDATLRQKALELGIVKTTKQALTPQQKVLAAQKAIYEQTTAAQGDFARTSGGLANGTRILNAQWQNITTTIGKAFLPLWQKMTQHTSKFLAGIAPKVTVWAGKLATGIGIAADAIDELWNSFDTGGIGAVLAKLEWMFSNWFDSFGLLTGPLGTVINSIRSFGKEAIAEITGWGPDVHPAISAFGTIMANVWALATGVFGDMLGWVTDHLPAWVSALASWGGAVATWVSGKLGEFFTWLTTWFTDDQKRTKLFNAISATWTFITDWAGGIAAAVSPYLVSLFTWLTSWVTDSSKRTTLWNGITATWDFFWKWAEYVGGAVAPYLVEFWGWLTSWVTEPAKRAQLWKGVTDTWDFAWKWAGYMITAVGPYLASFWSWLTSWVTDSAKRTQLWNGITSTWTGFTDWAGGLWAGANGKGGIQAKLLDLWTTVNSWLIKNYPQLKPWEDAFSTFTSSAKEQWSKDFPDMAAKFTKFREDVGTELGKLKKNFSDMWETLFGGSKGASGSSFVKALEEWATSIEGRIVGILHTLNLVFEALNIGMKEWKAILSGDFANAWDLQMKYFEKLGEIGSYIGQGIVNQLPGKATGGTVQAGRTYMTGERGPEIFTPSTNGYIYNAQDTAAMMSSKTLRVELAVTGESNLPMDRAKLRELARALYGEFNLGGSFMVTGP